MTADNLGVLVIERIIDVSPEQVFTAWTKPEHMKHWWGPKGFTLPFCSMDLRIGGIVHYCMRSPEGLSYWGKGTYREIVEPLRLVIDDTFSDEKGNTVPASQHGLSDEWPAQTQIITTFSELNGKTKLTLQHAGIPKTGQERDMCQDGWSQMLDRLTEYLNSKY